MINAQKLTSILQVLCAALGIPAAAGGTYSVYKSYFSPAANCQVLRASLLATMDRALPAESIRALMKKDMEGFATHCGANDPDAMAAFAAVSQQADATPPVTPDVKTDSAKPSVAPRAAGAFASIPIGIFGINHMGEAKGWIALDRRDQDHFGQTSFDGYEVGKPLAEGAILRAHWAVPVWKDMQPPGAPDLAHVQGRLSMGQCVRVIAVQAKSGWRPWAQAEPALCGPRF